MAYHAIYERATDGDIWAYFIEIPGVAGSGETIDAARASLLESVRLARESGADIPAPQDIVRATESQDVRAVLETSLRTR